jgi:hypothetical protein
MNDGKCGVNGAPYILTVAYLANQGCACSSSVANWRRVSSSPPLRPGIVIETSRNHVR